MPQKKSNHQRLKCGRFGVFPLIPKKEMDFFFLVLVWLPKRSILGKKRNLKGSPCLLSIYFLIKCNTTYKIKPSPGPHAPAQFPFAFEWNFWGYPGDLNKMGSKSVVRQTVSVEFENPWIPLISSSKQPVWTLPYRLKLKTYGKIQLFIMHYCKCLQGITGWRQVFPATSMEKGCKNHRETLYSSRGKIVCCGETL